MDGAQRPGRDAQLGRRRCGQAKTERERTKEEKGREGSERGEVEERFGDAVVGDKVEKARSSNIRA